MKNTYGNGIVYRNSIKRESIELNVDRLDFLGLYVDRLSDTHQVVAVGLDGLWDSFRTIGSTSPKERLELLSQAQLVFDTFKEGSLEEAPDVGDSTRYMNDRIRKSGLVDSAENRIRFTLSFYQDFLATFSST